MKIVLLRHGRTAANDAHLYCGSTDLPLSERGIAELESLRDRGIYRGFEDMPIYTSGMRRTEETCGILFGDCLHSALPQLREINFGAFEMRGYAELKSDPDYQAWISDQTGDFVPPDGEGAGAFRARVTAAGDALCGDGLIICHGGVIAALMAHWFPEENKNMYEWQPDHGRGYLILFNENGKSYAPIG